MPGTPAVPYKRDKNMKLKRNLIILSVALLACLVLLGGCAAEPSPYEQNDANGFTLSVRYDANGGFFTTNTSVIVDAYDPSTLPQQGGSYSLALLSPDDAARGKDAFAPVNNGYFLAGWYAERTQTPDGYVYGKRWDFASDKLEVPADGTYSSAEPVLTLYAAWVPLFRVEFHDLHSGELLGSYAFDPNDGTQLKVPNWNTETGAVDMYRFPVKPGHTFRAVYTDAEGKHAVKDAEISHNGTVDYETGTGKDTAMKLYVDYMEGEWYRIYTADQFLDNASVTGSYEICADLDFEGKIWPTSLMHGSFGGTIQGNGHTIKNVTFVQTNNSKTNAGLFGALTDTAQISDLHLQNISFTIKAGTRVVGTSYGLLAGSISAGATLVDVTITDSCLYVDSDCYFGTDEYAIGLVCGSGEAGIDYSGITAAATGSDPERVSITVEGQTVSVSIALE